MSKKKMRAFAGAMAVVLAFVPFLSGCAANVIADVQARKEAERKAALGLLQPID